MIIPAILAKTEAEYNLALNKISDCKYFDNKWIQIDFCDGEFVQNTTVGPEVIEKYQTNHLIEAHLMVEDPLKWCEQLDFGQIKRVVFPLELENTDQILAKLQALEVEIGIHLNPNTELSRIEKYLDQISSVLVMSVEPGYSAQEFLESTFDKVTKLVTMRRINNLQFKIEVDGGVSEKNYQQLIYLGVDDLIVGSHLLNGEIAENLAKFGVEL